MFILARHVTGDTAPSLVATTIFTIFPVSHRARDAPRTAMGDVHSALAVGCPPDDGVGPVAATGCWRGNLVWLQFSELCLLRRVPEPGAARLHAVASHVQGSRSAEAVRSATALRRGAGSGSHAALRLALSGGGSNRRVKASRGNHAVQAQPISYLVSPELNRIWGWTSDLWGAPERRLFPGLIALLLAAAAIRHPRRRMVLLYTRDDLVVVQLSFGLNGTLYRVLLGHVSSLQGFRALARVRHLCRLHDRHSRRAGNPGPARAAAVRIARAAHVRGGCHCAADCRFLRPAPSALSAR